jgi:hypothetical protein
VCLTSAKRGQFQPSTKTVQEQVQYNIIYKWHKKSRNNVNFKIQNKNKHGQMYNMKATDMDNEEKRTKKQCYKIPVSKI